MTSNFLCLICILCSIISDSVLLYNQGCFPNDYVMNILHPPMKIVTSYAQCLEICSSGNKNYMGIRVPAPDQLGCYCGDELPPPHRSVHHNRCTAKCPGNNMYICGELGFTRVIATRGADDSLRWSSREITENTYCGAITVVRNWLNTRQTRTSYRVRDDCRNKAKPLCIVLKDPCVGQELCPWYSHQQLVLFYTSNSTSPPIPWFEAQAFCESVAHKIQGRLIRLTHSIIKSIEIFLLEDINYWIPLAAWTWTRPLASGHVRWLEGEPVIADNTCTTLRADGLWSTTDCNKTVPFLCHRDGMSGPPSTSDPSSPTMPPDVTVIMEMNMTVVPTTSIPVTHTPSRTDQPRDMTSQKVKTIDVTTGTRNTSTDDTPTMILPSKGRGDSSTSAIAVGVVVPVVLLTLGLAVLVFLWWRRKKLMKPLMNAAHNPIYKLDSDLTIPPKPSPENSVSASQESSDCQTSSPVTMATSHYDIPPSSPYSVAHDVIINRARQDSSLPSPNNSSSQTGTEGEYSEIGSGYLEMGKSATDLQCEPAHTPHTSGVYETMNDSHISLVENTNYEKPYENVVYSNPC